MVATNLANIGLTHAYRGQFSRATVLLQEGVMTHQGWDNEWAKNCLALAHIHAGRYQRGRVLAETVVVDEEIWLEAWSVRLLGWVALAEEKYAEALEFSQRKCGGR